MEQVRNYFNAEKQESLLFVIVGLTAIFFTIYLLFFQKQVFYKALACPLLAVGMIQLVVGSTVWIRSPKDIIRVEQIIQDTPAEVQTQEIPRMQTVMKNFSIYRYIEIALLMIALTAMFLFDKSAIMTGIGAGLFMQSALMLSLDFFAERRAVLYFNFLMLQ